VPVDVHRADGSYAVWASAVGWLTGSAVLIVLLALVPPDKALGTAGWAIAFVACAGSLLLAALQRLRPRAVSLAGLLAMSYYGLAELALLQWLAGGRPLSYDVLALLLVVAVAAIHPVARVATFMAVLAATLSLPLLYGGWESGVATQVTTLVVVCGALAVVMATIGCRWRSQRAAQRDAGDKAGMELRDQVAVNERQAQSTIFAAHDMGSPLTAIKGYLEALLEGDVGELSKQQRDYALIVHRNAIRLQALTTDILAGPDGRPVHVEREPVDLGDVLHEVRGALSLAAQERILEVEVDDARSIVVSVERHLLYQAITNLVENAVKFSSPGATLRLCARAEHDWAIVEVVDHGIGIPAEELARVTEQYFRATNAGAVAGTGIGLAIVKGVVECHGGHLEVESELGVGSTFRIVLPTSQLPAGPQSDRQQASIAVAGAPG